MIKRNILFSTVKHKLKGGALYIAMMVGIVISLLLAMFILLARYNHGRVTEFGQNSQLQCNLKSALQMARSSYFTENRNGTWIKNGSNDDSIKIIRKYWGAYLLINAETKNRHLALSHTGLYGSAMSADTGLVTTDNGRPISVSGSVIFKANCYLPASGIKPAFIEGQSYIGNAQISSYVKKSALQIPQIEEAFVKGIKQQQMEMIGVQDSLVYNVSGTVSNSFKYKTIVIEVSKNLLHLHLKNNIKLISGNEINIDSSCHFENILIIAKKVRFKKGFKGSVHVIASDSIITEKETVFEFPSSFVVRSIDKYTKTLKCIIMGEKSIFNGGMIAFSESQTNTTDVFIKLHATGEVNGSVYSSGYLHMEGILHANIICNRLLLKTPSAVYENHILACEIDPERYSHVLSVPSIYNKNSGMMLSKNLGG